MSKPAGIDISLALAITELKAMIIQCQCFAGKTPGNIVGNIVAGKAQD